MVLNKIFERFKQIIVDNQEPQEHRQRSIISTVA